MQIKSIKETIKPNYPTNNERKNSFIKFLFEHKKITLSIALVLLINIKNTTFATKLPPISPTEIGGDQAISVIPQYLGYMQWGSYALAIGFLVYETIFNIVNHKKYKELSADEQKAFKKKHVKSTIIKILIILIIGTLFGFLGEYLLYHY